MTGKDILQSAQFVIDTDGKPTAALLDIESWQQLIAWIKAMESKSVDPTAQVPPLQSLEELWGNFWPDDESIDDFISTVRQWRQEDLTLHRDKV